MFLAHGALERFTGSVLRLQALGLRRLLDRCRFRVEGAEALNVLLIDDPADTPQEEVLTSPCTCLQIVITL